jgi:hypothetical protein
MTAPQGHLLRECLLLAGLGPSAGTAEEDVVLRRWLCRDLRRASRPGWRQQLPAAVEVGRGIYRSFMAAYTAAFLEPDGWGVRAVRRLLRLRFGFVDAHLAESILERIRDRRLVLLEHLRGKFQPSLFAPRTFDPARLRGYLWRVVRLESLHAPQEDLPWNRSGLPGVLCAGPGPGAVVADAGDVDYHDLGERLSAFWSPANGFGREDRLEGLVSLGLGWLTGEEALREGCERLLRAKLQAWEERLTRLRQRLSRLLDRGRELGEQTAAAPAERRAHLQDKAAELDLHLRRCRELLARHMLKLRPRPGEVCQLLRGCVQARGSAIRHARIGREIALLRRRVSQGWGRLRCDGSPPPAGVSALGEAIACHLGQEPASPRQHRLEEEERQSRRRRMRDWLAAGAELLRQIRASLAEHRARPARSRPRAEEVEAWLCDAEDLYELGVLTRKGVVWGLGRRHGWRLNHLLRVSGPALSRHAKLSTPFRDAR